MKRRRFIQQISLVTGGVLLASCKSYGIAEPEKKNKVKGRVTANGTGIKGVVISDGFSVVATDNDGVYEFEVASKAVNIFIATPAGYAFPQEKSIARHYRPIKGSNLKENINFELQKLTKDDNEHQFFVWADPQVQNAGDVAKMLVHSVPDVQKMVAAAGAGALLHGITVGDIVWDRLNLFEDYKGAVQKMNIPFFQCIGNHDMDYNIGDDDESDNTFQETFGPTYYSFNRGQVHYIVLDDVRYLGKDKEYDGFIAQKQLDWLKKDLSFVSKDKLIVLCAHIPIHNGIKNNADLYPILEGYNVHIMTGHTHYNRNVQIKPHIFEHNHGTVCGAWWTGGICGDGTPNGYGVYKVKGTELEWHYQGTGHKADYQFKIFVNNKTATEKELLVNIWNYDAAWKTAYKVDGIDKGTLQQFEGFDPDAYATLLGPEKPNPRGFAEPKKTDHLFRAAIPATARNFEVIVTDRFGKTYKELYTI